MKNVLSDNQLDEMIKSAVNSTGALPPDEKFSLLISALRELKKHRKATADHFQRGYDEGHSRGLTCGRLYKSDDQMRMHRAECVAAYKAELRGEESDE